MKIWYDLSKNTSKKITNTIIQNEISDIGRIKKETREVNLNGDDKRFWLGRLVDINDNKSNNSTSLNPEFFAERFELNDDAIAIIITGFISYSYYHNRI